MSHPVLVYNTYVLVNWIYMQGLFPLLKKKDTVKKLIFLHDEPKQRLRRRLHVNMILLSVMTAAANRIRARKQL